MLFKNPDAASAGACATVDRARRAKSQHPVPCSAQGDKHYRETGNAGAVSFGGWAVARRYD